MEYFIVLFFLKFVSGRSWIMGDIMLLLSWFIVFFVENWKILDQLLWNFWSPLRSGTIFGGKGVGSFPKCVWYNCFSLTFFRGGCFLRKALLDFPDLMNVIFVQAFSLGCLVRFMSGTMYHRVSFMRVSQFVFLLIGVVFWGVCSFEAIYNFFCFH